MTRFQLVFDCGAVTPPSDDSFMEFGKAHKLPRRGKDGRFRILVFDTDGGITRPKMRNGAAAPCWKCPCHRAAGRSQIVAVSEDPRLERRHLIRCYPKEVSLTEVSSVATVPVGITHEI